MATTDEPWFKVHFRTKTIIVHGLAELERLKARKVPKVVLVEPAKTHTCSTCGKVEAWLPSWLWFGSYEQIDDGKPVLKFCSDDCKERFAMSPKPKAAPRSRTGDRLSQHEPQKFDAKNYRAVDDAKRSANPRLFPWPEHQRLTGLKKGEGQCRWCGERITSRYAYQRTAHSARWGDARDCKHEMLLHIDLDYQTAFLIARDGPGCQLCDGTNGGWIAGNAMYPPERGTWIRWSVALQVDHVIPLWRVIDFPADERRYYFSPANLWLLCEQHHRIKSAKEAADRAAFRS